MIDDHIKRFNLNKKQPHKAFRLNADGPAIKTKDNAQPVIPPPRMVSLPQPALAPPGMMGSRLASDAQSKAQRQPDAPEKRPFKPLISNPDKSRSPDR